MSKKNTIEATLRQRTGSGVLNQLRREGQTPCVVYGAGKENTNVKINTKAFTDLLRDSLSANIIVDLDIEGTNQLAFIQDVQKDAISQKPIHIDFLAVDENTEITASLPLRFTGEARGVKNGGLLEQLVYTVEITCLPKDLPELIATDVTELRIGDSLHIGDLPMPDGCKPTGNADVLVCNVVKTRASMSSGESDEAEAAEGEAAAEGAEAPAAE